MLSIQADTSGLEKAIAAFSEIAKKDVEEIAKKQAAILVGHMIALTPPGGRKGEAMTDSGGIGLDAKKRGEDRVAADISRLFPTTNLKEERVKAMVRSGFEWREGSKGHKMIVREFTDSESRLALLHQQGRNPRTGRTRTTGGASMALTRKATLKAYIKQQIKNVGKLNSGWINAANELKTASRAVPAWIKRHGAGPGGADILRQNRFTGVRIFNNQQWFPSDMNSRAVLAIQRRERGLIKAMEEMLERNAKKAERKMG